MSAMDDRRAWILKLRYDIESMLDEAEYHETRAKWYREQIEIVKRHIEDLEKEEG